MTDIQNDAKIILFTSCKGGVGKSTVCANLAMSMATLGKKVLVIDCDFGDRCLDIIAGFSDSALYDIGDVLSHRISPERAVIRDARNENLFFVAAPYNFETHISPAVFRTVILSYANSGNYDFIFLDTPGGIGEPLLCAANVSDIAYIIVSPTKTAVRAADKTAAFLYGKGVGRQRLIVNEVTGKNVAFAKETILSIIDDSKVKLVGAVPYDSELIYAGNHGLLTDELYSETVTRAFDNIARRTLGFSIPLFHKIKKIKRLR
ncbi:MAG: P-loop NTPase [Clostridiales bacterium]|nr:P-loop NTPase [Clostridiales bacterium]